ncbi:MAG: hypothetical protein V2I54_09610 [Bacteroidales bacterium]|jgi:hypothetical protein|nr:hypothetical protein [Bacteroidales bacterium]
MKKLIALIIIIATITLISCEEDPDTPADFIASQGTYIGVVHLAYGELDGQALVYRFNEDNAEWQEISWTWSSNFDDNGVHLPDHYIVPGKEYRYKMRVYEESQGDEFSGYTNEITGYAYKGEPTEITSISRENSGDKVNITINWTNPNDLSEIKNLQYIEYWVYRAEDGNLSDYDYVVKREQMVTSPSDIQYEWSYNDNSLDPAKTYSYKIETRYRYNYTTSNGDYRDNEYYVIDGTTVEEDDSGNDENPVVNYTTTDLGQVLAATSGNTVFDPKDKVVNGTLYVEAISGSAAAGGTPSLYKLNGTSWQEVWTCSDLNQTMSSQFGVSSSGDSYLLGSDASTTVYKWDGSWTDIGLPENHDGLYGLEVFNDEVHLLIEDGGVLQVHKYNGTNWAQVGTDIASGSIFNKSLESINGNLYVTYIMNDVLYIKHLNGSSWDSDLQWEQEWLADIELAHTGSQLYFSSGSASTSFDGGVYRVNSSTTVENLIPEEHETWFTLGAFDLTIDNEGNLIVASMKYEYADESQTSLINYPHLNLYDGSEWKTLSGDFTDGIIPVTVSAIGTDIYYVYGEKASETATHDATVLKAKKLTP